MDELSKFGVTGAEFKASLIKKMRDKGHGAHADLLQYFKVVPVTPKTCRTACMFPGRLLIQVNYQVSDEHLEPAVRHEIMHEWLAHQERLEDYIKTHTDILKKLDLIAPTIDYKTGEKKVDENGNPVYSAKAYLQKLSNYAGDYEISNETYTEADKAVFRAFKIGLEVIRCLVTDDDHPDWINLTFEEMLDRLIAEYAKKKAEEPPKKPEEGPKGKGEKPEGPGEKPDGPGEKPGEKPKPKVIRGRFVDNKTFTDMDGKVIAQNED